MSEEKREEAEGLREEAEVERRLSEGGEQGAESGRVEAEEGRVVAEEKRASLRGFYFKLAGTVALPLAFLALIPALVGLYLLNERAEDNRALIRQIEGVNVQICLSVNELRRELYVAGADFNIAPSIRNRFLPNEDCENLP